MGCLEKLASKVEFGNMNTFQDTKLEKGIPGRSHGIFRMQRQGRFNFPVNSGWGSLRILVTPKRNTRKGGEYREEVGERGKGRSFWAFCVACKMHCALGTRRSQ